MIDFNQLSTLTFTSLVLAITFTIIAIAGIFFVVYRKETLKNFWAKFACLAILPFVALTMWCLAGLSITSVFAHEEALAIILSMIISAACITIIFFVARAIETASRKNEKEEVAKEKSKEELVEDLAKVEEDLSNLKGIIDDVIEEPKEEKEEPVAEETVAPVKVVVVTDSPVEVNPVVEEKVEEPVIEEKVEEVVAEEVKEPIEENKNQITFEDIIEELVKENTNKVETEKPEVVEEKVEAPVEEKVEEPVAEEKKEEVKPEPKKRGRKPKNKEVTIKVKADPEVKVEVKAETVVTEEPKKEEPKEEESDFIKSLNEILGQLENGSKDE